MELSLLLTVWVSWFKVPSRLSVGQDVMRAGRKWWWGTRVKGGGWICGWVSKKYWMGHKVDGGVEQWVLVEWWGDRGWLKGEWTSKWVTERSIRGCLRRQSDRLPDADVGCR